MAGVVGVRGAVACVLAHFAGSVMHFVTSVLAHLIVPCRHCVHAVVRSWRANVLGMGVVSLFTHGMMLVRRE